MHPLRRGVIQSDHFGHHALFGFIDGVDGEDEQPTDGAIAAAGGADEGGRLGSWQHARRDRGRLLVSPEAHRTRHLAIARDQQRDAP